MRLFVIIMVVLTALTVFTEGLDNILIQLQLKERDFFDEVGLLIILSHSKR